MLKILTLQLYMKLNLEKTTNNQVGRNDDKKNVFVYVLYTSHTLYFTACCISHIIF